MKITDRTKRSAAKQRLKRIKADYKAYSFGDTIYNSKFEKYAVLLKKELNGQFYFIVQDQYGKVRLQKFVYSSSVKLVDVATDGRQYAQNRVVFDSWIREAKVECNWYIRSYYNRLSIGITLKEKNCILVLKKEYNDEYYFVLQRYDKKHLIAKLTSFGYKVRVNIISTKEFDENKSVFYAWINEAKTQTRPKK